MRLCCTSNQNTFKASLVFLAGNPGEEIYGDCFKASSGKSVAPGITRVIQSVTKGKQNCIKIR